MKTALVLAGVLAAAASQRVTVDGKEAAPVSGYGESHARIESPAPDFTAEAVMPNGKIETISLSGYKGKWVVLLFYPLDFTFVCPTEILAFSDRADELKSIDTEILAISVDSKWTHYAWTEVPRDKGGLGKVNIPLVADLTREISKAYGVLLPKDGHALRGLFIIDPEGVLRQITMNQPPVGRSFEETLRLVQAFQHHAKVGEVCPLGWKPGDDTIQEDAKGKMNYFKNHH